MTARTTMRAITQRRYGTPDVLELETSPVPQELEPDQLLVEMRAAATNPFDWHMMTGSPWLVRTQNGWRRPKAPVGSDGAGVVVAVGADVTEFSPGDEVFGNLAGSFAEYATARERTLAPKPAGATFEQAASLPIAGVTALQGLRDVAEVSPGDRVLVNGASGGVGSFAVMIAKSMGAHVAGVCSTRNLELVRSAGADEVIDYTTTDYSRAGTEYDVVFDTVTTKGVFANRRVMADSSIWVQAGMKKKRSVLMLGLRALKRRLLTIGSRKRFRSFLAKVTKDDLRAIADLVESGKVAPVIGRTYPLDQTADAMRHQGEGHARGKTIITIDRR